MGFTEKKNVIFCSNLLFYFFGFFRDGDETAEFINFHRVLILLLDQCH
jgi:hypothetical protein